MVVSSAVDLSAVARVVGIETSFSDLRGGGIVFLPQRISVIGQVVSGQVFNPERRQVFNALETADLYGFGSPLHLAVRQLLPSNGDGVGTIPILVYPLADDGSGVAATGDIAPGGAQTEAASYIIRVNNIDSEAFVISVGDDAEAIVIAMTAAIQAVLEMPVTAAADLTPSSEKVDLTSKWKGTSANDINVEVIGSITAGTTFAVTQPAGGLVNPDVQPALDLFGTVLWQTMLLNCLEVADTTALDAYSALGEERWGALVRKPLVVFTGNTTTGVLTATAVSDARPTDRTNVQLVAPGSNDLPFVVASRQLARIAPLANNNPPHDYGSQDATGLVPGPDDEQWTFFERDAAVKKGSSTVEVKDGVVNVSDVVTFFHPTGDPTPAYRYVVDIVKLQNIIFNLDLIFATAEWDGAPLIPDNQPTTNRDAKTPKAAKAAVAAMLDSLALNAIISDPETAKANIIAEINATNPKRLDLCITVQLSGNTNIISISLRFGFFFGTPTVIV